MAISNGESTRHDTHTLIVCTTCRQGESRPGAVLIGALQDAGLPAGFAVAGTDCMSGCTRPCAVAFAAPGKMSFLFGGLTSESTADLIAFAELYRDRADGKVPWAERPEGLRRKILGRIPCLSAPQVRP